MSDSVKPIAPDIERMLDGLDENLEPLEATNESKKADEADAEDNKEKEQADESKESEKDTDDGEASDAEDASKEDAEGYTIDEDEADDAQEEDTPTNSTSENKTNPNLSPEESYILENLQPITVHGEVGDKAVELKVYAPEQLPRGFKYADERELSIANKAFNMLEGKAQQLQTDYRTQQNSKAAKDFKTAEDVADRTDIGELQRDGVIPKFKADPNSKDFESDPAAKLIQDVLDFKDKENARFLEEYNSGKSYKHIGFEEAYYKYQRKNPPEAKSPEVAKEDKERKEFARRTSKTSTTGGGKAAVPQVFRDSRSLNNFIDNLGWEE